MQYPFKELATSSELKREVVFTPRLEPIVEFDLERGGMITISEREAEREMTKTNNIRVIKTFQNFHLAPYGCFVALDLLLCNHLKSDFLRGHGAHVW